MSGKIISIYRNQFDVKPELPDYVVWFHLGIFVFLLSVVFFLSDLLAQEIIHTHNFLSRSAHSETRPGNFPAHWDNSEIHPGNAAARLAYNEMRPGNIITHCGNKETHCAIMIMRPANTLVH